MLGALTISLLWASVVGGSPAGEICADRTGFISGDRVCRALSGQPCRDSSKPSGAWGSRGSFCQALGGRLDGDRCSAGRLEVLIARFLDRGVFPAVALCAGPQLGPALGAEDRQEPGLWLLGVPAPESMVCWQEKHLWLEEHEASHWSGDLFASNDEPGAFVDDEPTGRPEVNYLSEFVHGKTELRCRPRPRLALGWRAPLRAWTTFELAPDFSGPRQWSFDGYRVAETAVARGTTDVLCLCSEDGCEAFRVEAGRIVAVPSGTCSE